MAEWADAIEGREDIGRTDADDDLLNDILFDLATPELSGALTLEMSQALRAQLDA